MIYQLQHHQPCCELWSTYNWNAKPVLFKLAFFGCLALLSHLRVKEALKNKMTWKSGHRCASLTWINWISCNTCITCTTKISWDIIDIYRRHTCTTKISHQLTSWDIIDYHWLSLIIIDYHCLSLLAYHCLSLIIIDYHRLSLITIDYHWFSLIIIDYYWLSLIVIDCHWLSLIINTLFGWIWSMIQESKRQA